MEVSGSKTPVLLTLVIGGGVQPLCPIPPSLSGENDYGTH